jgi:hypothetical protein
MSTFWNLGYQRTSARMQVRRGWDVGQQRWFAGQGMWFAGQDDRADLF